MSEKKVFFFGGGEADGSSDMKKTLGGKGANLAVMTQLGIPVPPGFTISTDVCLEYLEKGDYTGTVKDEVENSISRLEKLMGAEFGSRESPLLLSVRSGGAVSMPGMMDSVLNLGLNDETVRGLINRSESAVFGLDCYRRFLKMYGDVVEGINADDFEKALENKKEEQNIQYDYELS